MRVSVLDQRLTTSVEAAQAYRAGHWAEALALDPTFALAHATLALVGHARGVPIDICSRLRDAELHARRSTPQERCQVEAILRHVRSGGIIAR
jgi:hypothetical protein